MAKRKAKQQANNYGCLQNSEKKLKTEAGIFVFPEALEGKTDHGLRKFLVFYFDSEEDYKVVLETFRKKVTKTRSHPDLDSKKLAEAAHLINQ